MANDVKKLCDHFSSLSVTPWECNRCCQPMCPCFRDLHFCESCLDALVASGATIHPITQSPLPICVCGHYFGFECRARSIGNVKELEPLIFTSDPAENKRHLLTAKRYEPLRHFIKK